MGSSIAGTCNGADLSTPQGITHAFTREDEQEIVDCTLKLSQAMEDPSKAAVLKDVPPNLVGRYLDNVRSLHSLSYARPSANPGEPAMVDIESVHRHAFGLIGQNLPAQVLADVAVHKASSGAAAISLGGSIGKGDNAERKKRGGAVHLPGGQRHLARRSTEARFRRPPDPDPARQFAGPFASPVGLRRQPVELP